MTKLSICIPTFNRVSFLVDCVNSIVDQLEPADLIDVEIVICDNASSDGTQDACLNLIAQHPHLICYYRQDQNVGMGNNFWKALSLGKGDYLKGINDYVLFLPGSVRLLIDIIDSCADSKVPLFFLNGAFGYDELASGIISIDQLIKHASFWITWWSGYGVWRDLLPPVELFCRNIHLLLPQTEDFLRQVSDTGYCTVINKELFLSRNPGPKSVYNIAEIFGKNYIGILKQYVLSGQLSKESLEVEKLEILVKHILPFHFNIGHENNFDFDEKTLDYLQDFTTLKDFYPIYLQGLRLQRAPETVEPHGSVPSPSADLSRIQRFPFPEIQEIAATPESWRVCNPHNQTFLGSAIKCPRVSVGNFSYGVINISEYDHPSEGLKIGNFVSIAPDVLFMLGGNHPYKGFSTYPFAVFFFHHPIEAKTKGEIVIQDDVWIGHGATILSGVSIGQGAIVGAKSVVVKDVPPYAIVCGNPAAVVKYRFEPHIVEKLKMIDFSRVDWQLASTMGIAKIYEEVTDDNVDQLLAYFPLRCEDPA